MLKCDLCGQPLPNKHATFTPKGDDYIITCPNHTQLFDTCNLCRQVQTCDFETNPSKIPKVVQKQIKQGPMTQIVQIKNPDRITETCQKGCKCYNAEYGCGKEYGICGNYDEIPVKK